MNTHCEYAHCTEPLYADGNNLSMRRCFNHYMKYLERRKLANEKKRGDHCPDGPWCGCDQHRGIDDND